MALDDLVRELSDNPSRALNARSAEILLEGVWRARCAIVSVYDRGHGGFESKLKEDASPVTEADWQADAILRETLVERMGFASDLVISEEHDAGRASASALASDHEMRFFVDPLDGTREFLRRSGQFVICIGAVHERRPIFGLIHAPVTGETMMAWQPQSCDGQKRAFGFHLGAAGGPRGESRAWAVSRIRAIGGGLVQHDSPSVLIVLLSGSSPAEVGALPSKALSVFEAAGIPCRVVRMGSALKFCHIAEGFADVYLRRAPTSYWDTVAGQAIVENAGGTVFMLERASSAAGEPATDESSARGVTGFEPRPMTYSRASLENSPFAVFRPGLGGEIQERVLEAMARSFGS